MRVKILITATSLLLASCGGCRTQGAKIIDDGSGDPNDRTLWPLHEGYTQSLVLVSDPITRHSLRAERERHGEAVLPFARPGKTGGSVARRPNEPATMTFLSRGVDGILDHGHLRQTYDPELLVPDTARVGMRWTSRDGQREFEFIDRTVRPTIFGVLPVWTLRIFDARQDFLKFASTDPQLERGQWIDVTFVEGYGPEGNVGDFRSMPGDNVAYTIVPLDDQPTPAPINASIALEPLDGTLDTSILIENMHAIEVSPGDYELRMHGISYGFSNPGGGVDGNFFAGWSLAGMAYDASSRILSPSDGGFSHGLGALANADGEYSSIRTEGELPAPVQQNCGANGTSNCYFGQVGLLRGEDGVIDQLLSRPGYPRQPGLFLRRKVNEERYIGDVFGAFDTRSVIVTTREPGGGYTFIGARRDGMLASASWDETSIAAISSHTEGTYGAVTKLDGRAFFDVSPDGRLAELKVEDGLIERVVIADLDVPDGHLVEGALVIEDHILVVTNSGFTGVDAMIEDDVRLNTGIPPELGDHHFFVAKLPSGTTPGEHAAASVWVEPQQADMLVCWDPAFGEASLDGWMLGGYPAAAVRVGPRGECVLLIRGPESRGDRYSEGAFRVEGRVPGAGEVMIGVSTAWALNGHRSWLSRSYYANEGTVYEGGAYLNRGGRTGANGAPAAGFIADKGFQLPVSLGPEHADFYEVGLGQCGGAHELVIQPDRSCCVRDGFELTRTCHDPEETSLFVRDGSILALDERTGGLVIIRGDARTEVDQGEVLDEITLWWEDKICGVAMGAAGCLSAGEFVPFDGPEGELPGATPRWGGGGLAYDILGAGEALARFDLDAMSVERVPIGLLDDPEIPDERWTLERTHALTDGVMLLYKNNWGTDRRALFVAGDKIELLDRPELSLIGEDATLWAEEDLFIWIWPVPTSAGADARLDALRIPRRP